MGRDVPARVWCLVSLRNVYRVLLLLALATAPVWVSFLIWQFTPWKPTKIVLVDYTVPFESAREHRGAIWLLNHEKYQPPVGERWLPLTSHAGYDPTKRETQSPIASLDLSGKEWLFVTDSYGVYADDLLGIPTETAHIDFSKKVFGGISNDDARAMATFVAGGHHLYLEYNGLEEPTQPEARAVMEELLGVHWTGWTGRSFLNLYDTADVPHWLPRLYRQQYGNDNMPEGPTLAFIHRNGRLLLISNPDAPRVAPRVMLTPTGNELLPAASSGANYYYWFPVLEALPGTEVLAEFALPDLPAMPVLLREMNASERIPLLTRKVLLGSHRIYMAADLSDTDFEPGHYRFAGISWLRSITQRRRDAFTSQNPYWQFYVPAVTRLLSAPTR